ncbi:MAG: hypothetical protein JW951_05615 [Lentisphaerae bacterium]|nr:hypothetical protein [Lentisphaerota bacterium]
MRTGLILAGAAAAMQTTGADFGARHAGTRVLRGADGRLAVEIVDPAQPPPEYAYRDRFSPAAFITQAVCDGTPFVYAAVNHAPQPFLGGLPMEFDLSERTLPPGFAEAAVGEPFLKIGVGILEKTGERYRFTEDYPDVEKAVTETAWRPDGATFTQRLNGRAQGYAYALETDAALAGNRLTLTYTLENTGSRGFTTEQYVHNFLRFADRDLGPAYCLTFPYAYTLCDNQNRPDPEPAPVFRRAGDTVLSFADPADGTNMGGKTFVVAPADYTGPNRVTVVHAETGQRLDIAASRPAHNVAVWTTAFQLSPEVNIQVSLAPGERATWTRTYTFGP